jgi:hypothetical protein
MGKGTKGFPVIFRGDDGDDGDDDGYDNGQFRFTSGGEEMVSHQDNGRNNSIVIICVRLLVSMYCVFRVFKLCWFLVVALFYAPNNRPRLQSVPQNV